MKVFIICPVRNASNEQKSLIETYVLKKEMEGVTVYYPARDTDQQDDSGIQICISNAKAIEAADEVHIFWDAHSVGSLFDLGVAWGLHKPIAIINPNGVEKTPHKSFENVILQWGLGSAFMNAESEKKA